VRHAIRARHYSRRTEQAYVDWIRRYIIFHNTKQVPECGDRVGMAVCISGGADLPRSAVRAAVLVSPARVSRAAGA